jgi:hypothetical protein
LYALELHSSAANGSIFSAVSPLATPEPSAFMLAGIGLIAVALFARARRARLSE